MDPRGFVVLLEDDPLIRPLLERWLGDAGYRVAAHGEKVPRPALVIADVPDPKTADVFITTLQAYAAPILVLSARFRRGLANSPAAARRLGVNRVLPKPFTRTELLSAVRDALEGAG